MPSLRLPGISDTAVTTVVELLAYAVAYVQVSGNLKFEEGEVEIGDPIAIDTASEKFVKYNQAGSNGAEVCVGFVRIPGDSTDAEVPIEVVIAGAVKYSVVSEADNWHSDILTDLKARVVAIADALLFW